MVQKQRQNIAQKIKSCRKLETMIEDWVILLILRLVDIPPTRFLSLTKFDKMCMTPYSIITARLNYVVRNHQPFQNEKKPSNVISSDEIKLDNTLANKSFDLEKQQFQPNLPKPNRNPLMLIQLIILVAVQFVIFFNWDNIVRWN